MFYLTTHSIHFIYGYMASDIWLRTILIARKETRYSYRLTARVLLYAPSHRQDNTYHGFCYTSRGALAGARNSSMGPPHEGKYPTTHRTMSERSTSELRPAPPTTVTLNLALGRHVIQIPTSLKAVRVIRILDRSAGTANYRDALGLQEGRKCII